MTRAKFTVSRAVAALLAAVGLTASSLLGVATAPAASAAEPCVGVIVDGRLFGSSLTYSCARGDPNSGLAALRMAGYSYTPRPRDNLICQINGRPACTDTTTDTYWSYWYRAPGSSSWVYSSQGAGSHDPKPGSTEAWVWQDGGRRTPPSIGQQTICPQPQASATKKPTSRPTSGGGGSGGGGSGGSGGSGSGDQASARASAPPVGASSAAKTKASAAARASTSAAKAAAKRKAQSTATTSSSPASTSSAPSSSAAATEAQRLDNAVAPTSGGGGPPWPGLVAGGALIIGIGTAAAVRVLRARRQV